MRRNRKEIEKENLTDDSSSSAASSPLMISFFLSQLRRIHLTTFVDPMWTPETHMHHAVEGGEMHEREDGGTKVFEHAKENLSAGLHPATWVSVWS
jgi:hypothetical protein